MSAFSGETTTKSGLDAEFSPFVQQAQQCGRSEFSHPRSPSTQTCLAGLKNETGR